MQHIDGDGEYFKCYNVMKLISDYDKWMEGITAGIRDISRTHFGGHPSCGLD